ncbi:hypothetical protein [Emticicia sp. SJ17W-69]|uniref:hypothetical protein n=1 Tax=Emticicia sp. SJ17W-69 TaxID=3421657 RepID=UPI003EBC3556
MKEFAQIGLLVILSICIIFHVLVLVKTIPYKIVWGSRLTNDTDMYKFETVSLVLNAFFLLVALLEAEFLEFEFPERILNYILWGMFVLFLFNIFGNIQSKNTLEKMIFTPIAVLLMIFSFILAVIK